MVVMKESALELVRQKKHPDAVQEEAVIEFEDFELPEEHRGITQMMQKIWEACPKGLVDVFLILTAVLLIATVLLKKMMLGAITLGVAAIAIALAMAMIVRDCKRC